MRAGRLDIKGSFYSKSETRDVYNASVVSYSFAFDTWGELRYVNGDLIVSNEEKFYSGVAFFSVRYRSEIVETMRVDIKGITYRITYIEELGRKEGMKLSLSKINE